MNTTSIFAGKFVEGRWREVERTIDVAAAASVCDTDGYGLALVLRVDFLLADWRH